MPERDYSHRSLIEKLGVSAGQRIAAVNVGNQAFLSLLADACAAAVSASPRGTYDRIFLQIDASRDLALIAKLRKHLKLTVRFGSSTRKGVMLRSRTLRCALLTWRAGWSTTRSAHTPIRTPQPDASYRCTCEVSAL